MKLQYLCHLTTLVALLAFAAPGGAEDAARTGAPAHQYPTIARVEYVNECVGRNGGKLAALYQCACAIDKIADALSYDDYVEASTFAKYATLPGQGGSIFRDSDRARQLAKSYRALETDAWRGCGIAS
jgi:hypothetical protein